MQTQNPAAPEQAATKATRPSGNALRADATRHKICSAVMACLDEVGYHATSITRVQALAGVSRGAMTHHFPSKEDLMVETAERLLDPVRGQSGPRAKSVPRLSAGHGDGVQADLVRLWTRVVNTREGRALLEILIAARTDLALQQKIAPSLKAYDNDINRNILGLYRSVHRGDDDVATLWTICRAFLRGLHLQRRFDDNPQKIRQVIERFGELMAPHMSARSGPDQPS
jgi:AcrR family transcriptional regulator